MNRARAVGSQRRNVRLRRITLVLVETVYGKAAMPAPHEPVSANFGENRCSADCGYRLIPTDDGFNLEGLDIAAITRCLQPVDANESGDDSKLCNCARHRQQRRLEDVQVVDLGRLGQRNRESARLGTHGARHSIALSRRKPLGICELGDRTVLVEDDRGRYHGPGERPAPSFVNARHRWQGI